jgi:hypothetical protein
VRFVFNDRSIHGQFPDRSAFHESIGRFMALRDKLRDRGYDIFCSKKLTEVRVTDSEFMRQAVVGMPEARLKALMQWLTRIGPYWEHTRLHASDDYLEANQEVVTDSGIGEVAVAISQGDKKNALISVDPSRWLLSPIVVRWLGKEPEEEIPAPNYWERNAVEEYLLQVAAEDQSWRGLERYLRQKHSEFNFSDTAFRGLDGCPYSAGIAARLRELFRMLASLCREHDGEGIRSERGHRIYEELFTGDKSWFSDSSDTEKKNFRKDLTFPDPAGGPGLFCPFHGKLRGGLQIRVHFTWPIAAARKLTIVYLGPKLTKD